MAIIMVDYNAHHTIWNCSCICKSGAEIAKLLQEINLTVIYSNSPTMCSPNNLDTPSRIGFALLNNIIYPYEINVISCLNSDHLPLLLSLNISPANISALTPYRQTDFTKFVSYLTNYLTCCIATNDPKIIDQELITLTN